MTTQRALPVSCPLPRGFAGYVSGLTAFLVGLRLVLPGGGLFRYALGPIFAGAVLLLGLAVGSFFLARALLVDWLTSVDFAPWLSWIGAVLALLLSLLIAYFFFSPVMKIFGPIFIDPICERVHIRYTGVPLIGPRSADAFAKRQLFALVQSVKWLGVTLLVEIPLAILALLTIVGAAIALPVSALIQGSDLMDFPLALRHYGVKQKLQWSRLHLAPALGLGTAASLCIIIPGLNLFAIPAGAAGATILMLAADNAKPVQVPRLR
jgi:CysZ protein